MTTIRRTCLATILVLICGPAVYGQGAVPIGGEFQINSYTTDTQSFPSLAVLADGRVVAVWQSRGSSGSDSSDVSIQGQLYDAGGSSLGEQFQVNSYTTTGSQRRPSLTPLADGGFAVAWDRSSKILAQRYAADGTAMGGGFQVNTSGGRYQSSASLAGLSDGGFVVLWQGRADSARSRRETRSKEIKGPPPALDIFGQRYAADGSPVGEELRVNTDGENRQDGAIGRGPGRRWLRGALAQPGLGGSFEHSGSTLHCGRKHAGRGVPGQSRH